MGQNNEIIAAIDVGTTKIVVIIGQKDANGNIEVLGYGRTDSHGVKRGAVNNITTTIKEIKEAVQKAEAASGITITEAYVGIAGQHIRSQHFTQTVNRNSANSAISQADVDNLINQMREVPTQMGEEVLHILPQSFTVDNEIGIHNPVGMEGKQLSGDFHIIYGQTALANNLRRCIESNNIKVKGLILEPLASSTAVLSDDDKELGVALVDIGGGTTDLAIFKDGQIIHSCVIPCGGNIITSDIQQGCKILERDAEKLKIEYGAALSSKAMQNQVVTIPSSGGLKPKEITLYMLSQIISARMQEIIATVRQEIINAGARDSLGAGIVITGGGAMLRHLPQLFAGCTGYEVRIGYPSRLLKTDNKDVSNEPSNSTAVGLMMMGLNNVRIDGIGFDVKTSDKEQAEPVNDNDNAETAAEAQQPQTGKGKKMKDKIKTFWDNFVYNDEDDNLK